MNYTPKNKSYFPTLPDPDNWHWLAILLFTQPKKDRQQSFFYARVFLTILLIIFTFQLFLSGANAGIVTFLHNINLPIHESGHIVFRVFGNRVLTSMGGSLFQIIMPIVCAGALVLKTRDPYGGSIAMWWAFENFIDIAPYIGDARAGVLPLIGGNTGLTAPYGFHDWQFILTELGYRRFDTTIASISQWIGITGVITCLVWGIATLLVAKIYKDLG